MSFGEAETASGNGIRLWAGRIADSFYIDLSLLSLINAAAAKYIGEQVAAVVAAAGTSDDPSGYGQALAGALFPDVGDSSFPYVVPA